MTPRYKGGKCFNIFENSKCNLNNSKEIKAYFNFIILFE